MDMKVRKKTMEIVEEFDSDGNPARQTTTEIQEFYSPKDFVWPGVYAKDSMGVVCSEGLSSSPTIGRTHAEGASSVCASPDIRAESPFVPR